MKTILKEHWFKMICSIAIVLIALSVGYYFIFVLPAFNKEKLDIEKAKQEEEAKKNEREEEAKKAEKASAVMESATKKINLSNCLNKAEENYSSNWAKACETNSEIMKDLFDKCKGGILDDGKFCEKTYDFEYKPDCALPSAKADKVNEYLKNDKDECFRINEN